MKATKCPTCHRDTLTGDKCVTCLLKTGDAKKEQTDGR